MHRLLLRAFSTSSAVAKPRVLVVGGNGALGRAVVDSFNAREWETVSVDVAPSSDATTSLTLPTSEPWKVQAQFIKDSLTKLGVPKDGLDAVVCTAGGWQGGGIAEDSVFDSVDKMLDVCLRPAITSSHVAASFLRPGGILVLTGSDAALKPTPGMLGYGLAKDGTHFLVKSLASGGLQGRTVVGILPTVIDTESNRAGMPGADTSSWTLPQVIADKTAVWASTPSLAKNGCLYRALTKAGKTQWFERKLESDKGSKDLD